jgi:hypothetical protein
MVKWSGWSAPLVGAAGGAFGGLGLADDPRFPFRSWQASLGGALAGLVAGFYLWLVVY